MKTLFLLLFSIIAIELSAQAGSLDATFATGSGANSSIYSIAVQSDNKILIAGAFTTFNNISNSRIARLNEEGTIDSSFNPGTGADNTVTAVRLQSDGKIIIAGDFLNYNGVSKNYIARLNSDGSLDATFIGSGANGPISSIAIQTDDKIVIGGEFTSYNGVSKNNIVRLNANGNLDGSFTGSGANNIVYSIAVQTDSRILIGGLFTSYAGTSRNRIARINSTGSLQTGFDPGSGASSVVQSIAIQEDGKILIGGNFFSYNGVSTSYFARLTSGGALDTGFNKGTGPNGDIFSIMLQPDGKIIIGGSFGNYNGVNRSSFARLNTDGSLDTNFNPGTGALADGSVANVYASALQSDGKIIIGGSFTSYNGVGRNRIARILSADATLASQDMTKNKVQFYPNPTNGILSFSQKANVIVYNTVGQKVAEQKQITTLDISKLKKGIYIVVLSDDSGKEILKSKVLKE